MHRTYNTSEKLTSAPLFVQSRYIGNAKDKEIKGDIAYKKGSTILLYFNTLQLYIQGNIMNIQTYLSLKIDILKYDAKTYFLVSLYANFLKLCKL